MLNRYVLLCCVVVFATFTCCEILIAADWPQYMGSAAHTGDAQQEELTFPLKLSAQVQLEDAVTTSAAVVGGRAYVVDQMGTAYCIDSTTGKIVWKSEPENKQARGSNTSSPCIVKGRMYYGTTAGNFHILDTDSGTVLRTIDLGWPIPGSPTAAADRIYLQTVGAVLYCFDLNGNEQWKWDHYAQYQKPLPEKLKTYHPRGYDRPNYAGGEVAVAGGRIVTAFGWDQVCLVDEGKQPRLAWCNRAALGKDDGIPMSSSIHNNRVYTAWPGVDGAGSLLRVSLTDGSFDRSQDQLRNEWAILGTPAVRDSRVYFGTHQRHVKAYEFGVRTHWTSGGDYPKDRTPVFSSPVLSKNHCLYTTVDGQLVAVDLTSQGWVNKQKGKPFRFQTRSGKVIATTPVVSNGKVFFGSDDGCLYILSSSAGEAEISQKTPQPLHQRKSKGVTASGEKYAWPSPNGDCGNTRYVPDATLRPPFRMKWAVRSFGLFHQPMTATTEDLIYSTRAGTVVCMEQETARIRWRMRLPEQTNDSSGLVCHQGRVYVARSPNASDTFKKALFCLDQQDGKILWHREIGKGGQGISKSPPVIAGRNIAYATLRGDPAQPVVQAWNAETGKPAWEVRLSVTPKTERQKLRRTSGCAVGDVMFFSAGGMTDWAPKDRYPGETVAIDANSGKVLWRTREAFTTTYSAIMARDERLYIIACAGPMTCLSAKDGSVVWRSKQEHNYFQHGATLGPDFFLVKGYGGHTHRYSLADCTLQSSKLGGPEHTCSSAIATKSGLSIVVTVGGIYVRDVNTNKLLWLSDKGFAPRNCTNPAISNGCLYLNPQVNGMLYCFEGVQQKR